MATCARCGADILWKRLDGAPFAVDAHEATVGKGRFVERDGHLLSVRDDVEVAAYVGHRETCPK